MYTITKGELWTIRQALEEGEPEYVDDAKSIVNSILDKNVTIEITEDQMLNDNPDDKLTDDEQASLLTEEDLVEAHRVC